MSSVIRYTLVALVLFLYSLPAHANVEALRALMAEAAEFQAEYRKAMRTQGQVVAGKEEMSGKELALNNAFEALKSGRRQKGCPQESAEKKVAAACNAEAARLAGLSNQLLGQADGQKKYAALLQREREKLNQVAMTRENKRKSVDALLGVLDVAFQSWQRRYAAIVFKAPPYNRLVSTQEGASNCKPLAASGKEAILEEAQRCLQWLWVGTLQNR